jgi:hypothetical protein
VYTIQFNNDHVQWLNKAMERVESMKIAGAISLASILAVALLAMGSVVQVNAQLAQNCGGAPTIPGTDGNDVLIDTPANDNIHGKDGNDFISAPVGGNDQVRGGSGNDFIVVNGGDTVCAGDGNDLILAINGEVDRIICSDGEDFAFVDPDDDVVDPDDCETLFVAQD